MTFWGGVVCGVFMGACLAALLFILTEERDV